MKNYLVATLGDRLQAEAVYTQLEKDGFPMEKVALLGRGYKQWAELGLIDPFQVARQQMQRMLIWLVPFGFFAGFTFNQATQIDILPMLDRLNNSILGGIFGAIAGALGSLTVGGGLQVVITGKSGIPFEKRLQRGKYLILIQGSDSEIRRAERLLKVQPLENLQSYTLDE
ncbi:hypothetical protein D3A95_07810 [Thermosynechococcus sichuanensis E542]|uniref:DUF1269 domain-containing protein n=1 Tax=Thermosynechococcus sichuanensis E542 TaxID=2016101 RepID=A0A3B7MF69_9CYAN|nr:hypothetical protein [Thermosynechococcus vestitus]AXY68044.1 hypothetical protein D3A95_07810 [Thermosynechococcus vestitus E542]